MIPVLEEVEKEEEVVRVVGVPGLGFLDKRAAAKLGDILLVEILTNFLLMLHLIQTRFCCILGKTRHAIFRKFSENFKMGFLAMNFREQKSRNKIQQINA